ncbi:MAG: sugar ABC transporter permease [Acidimicrobiales bacterium]
MSTEQDVDGGLATTATGTAPEPPPVDLALIDANTAGSLSEYARAWVKRIRNGDIGLLPVIGGLILIVIIFQTQKSVFLSAGNFAALLSQASYFILFGMAEVFVLLLGEIDLSTGYVAACGAVVTLILAGQLHNVPWWLAIIAGLALTTVIGAVQGALVTRLRLPSFVVTLGGLLAFEGLLLFILNKYAGKSSGGTVAITNTILVDLDNGAVTPAAGWIIMVVLVMVFAAFVLFRDRARKASGLVAPPLALNVIKIVAVAVVGVAVVVICNLNRGPSRGRVIEGVPWCVFIILGIVTAATFLLSRTRFGRYVYAVGGNAEAARRSGINVNRIRLMCFTLCSFTAGLAGLFYASFIQSISQSVDGGNLVLYAVAAAVIGGTSLFGGRGKIIHAVLGGVVIATIYNGMGLVGLSADAQDIVTALVLIAAATVDAVARRGRTAA